MQRDIHMQCTASRQQIPVLQEEQVLYLLVEIFPAAEGIGQSRLPLDICLLLDCSSSMRGDRLFEAKEAGRYIVSQLTPDDYFCLVAFNDAATVIVPRQPVQTPVSLREHITDVQASGGTEMARGLEQALEQMSRAVAFSGVRRIILLTDGQTYGDENRCVELARRAQQSGIGITALGVGDEWNEDLLSTVAAHGNSRSEYIASAEAIIPLFREEMRLLQGIVAQEMALTVRPAAGLAIQSFFRVSPEIAPLSLQERERGRLVPLGEWLGTDPQAFLAEMVITPLPPGNHRVLQVNFSYRLPREHSRRETSYDLYLACIPAAPPQAEIPERVRQGLERLTAYRLQESAWQDARRGDIDQATRRLEAAATRLVQLGEDRLARVVEEEALRLQRTGRASASAKKTILYGTQRLGRHRHEQERME